MLGLGPTQLSPASRKLRDRTSSGDSLRARQNTMRVVLIAAAVLLFCCVRNSRASETDERGVENQNENTSQTDRIQNCLPDMCELLMKIGGMEARLKATETQNEGNVKSVCEHAAV